MKMPDLPEPYWENGEALGSHFAMNDYFTADQMRAYGEECARLAREEEREKLALMCEAMMDPLDDGWDSCLREVAAAIRNGVLREGEGI